jgi:hypothetical protein
MYREPRLSRRIRHRAPDNEIGAAMFVDLEQFATTLETVTPANTASPLIIYSDQPHAFSTYIYFRALYARALLTGHLVCGTIN